jgi:hypothetical protein
LIFLHFAKNAKFLKTNFIKKTSKKGDFLDKKGAFRLFIAKKSQKPDFYKFKKQLFFKLPILFAKK